jgi:acetyl-CoA carboxylase carboxyl transferase subunit alpha
METTQFALDFEKPLRDLVTQLDALKKSSREQKVDLGGEIRAIERKIEATKREIYSNLTAWQKVQLARHPKRPYALDYINAIFEDFEELHGDRSYGDDQALIGGTAFFEGKAIVVIAQQKGRDAKENVRRNFGMPQPEGYRKALRLMKMADRFKLPIITLIDTPGAYPGVEAEERHVAEAIAVNMAEMSTLTVPIIAIVIGEGGSGGALGIGVADRILIMENAYYSVITPEGCAAILWKDRAHAPAAAEAMKIGAKDLLRHGIADEVIEEPFGGAHRDPDIAASNLQRALTTHLRAVRSLSGKARIEERYRKYRSIGVFVEPVSDAEEAEDGEEQTKAG